MFNLQWSLHVWPHIDTIGHPNPATKAETTIPVPYPDDMPPIPTRRPGPCRFPKPGHTGHSLQWRHNGLDGVSNHQLHECLLNRLFRRRSKKTSKLRATGLCVGNSPVVGEFPAQMASNAENVSIWWRHHVILVLCRIFYFFIMCIRTRMSFHVSSRIRHQLYGG